ncbi:PhnD/SsuA/transferrin family substrate-binding protein [uncultured Methanomethylovorans sp.]|uniref:PhnD/SsuA/transferrin family substrate-binding protein n=1 Tax=uncultured Methanomethylovorans sp. TaxID=183759 RepID=UPI002AA90746|nr:PhnD/SsuA/transferrin family substrate-binding protein [uncultured Methanomethylovorans sp.]
MLTGGNFLNAFVKGSSLILLLILLFSSLASCEENIVNIGVMVGSDGIHTMDNWTDTINYLNSESDTHIFKLVPMQFNNFSKIEANEIDFFICNPWMYVEAENKYGVAAIASHKHKWKDKYYTTYGTVFITQVNRTDINSLEDLKDHSFMYVDNASFASYLITLHELQQIERGSNTSQNPDTPPPPPLPIHGMHEDLLKKSPFKTVSFGENSAAVVFAVKDGKVDGGAIKTGTLEEMAAKGLINLEDFKVLNQQHVEGFPFLLSSRLYPEWVFARTNNVPDEVVEEVAIALLKMPAEDEGWTVPQNYNHVRELLMDLRIGSYRDIGKMSLTDIITRYWYFFALILMLLFVMGLTTTYIDSVNRNYKKELANRQKAEQSLIESEDKFAKISTSAQDAIIMIDNKGLVTFWNRAAEKMFDYTKEEVLGKDLHSLIAPDEYKDGYKQGFAGFVAEGKGTALGQTISLKAKKKTGEEFPVELSLSSFVLKDGTWNAAGIIRDITYRKKTEEALVDARITAESANRTKSEFLANMSHELRTPLNSIIGFSDMLLEKTTGDLNEKQIKYLRNISTSGRHLLTLINDILDLSKVDAGKMQISYENCSINEVYTDIKNTLSNFAISKSITLNFEIEANLTEIYADKLKLKQIMYNLVSNAIKFTPEHGSVHIIASARSNMLHMEVRDTGIGISAEDQKKLFSAFTQLDSTYSRKYQGTGLGLVLVKKFVEMHGGRVWVESEIAKGSSFAFEMPITKKT